MNLCLLAYTLSLCFNTWSLFYHPSAPRYHSPLHCGRRGDHLAIIMRHLAAFWRAVVSPTSAYFSVDASIPTLRSHAHSSSTKGNYLSRKWSLMTFTSVWTWVALRMRRVPMYEKSERCVCVMLLLNRGNDGAELNRSVLTSRILRDVMYLLWRHVYNMTSCVFYDVMTRVWRHGSCSMFDYHIPSRILDDVMNLVWRQRANNS